MKKSLSLKELSDNLNLLISVGLERDYTFFYGKKRTFPINGVKIYKENIAFMYDDILILEQNNLYIEGPSSIDLYPVYSGNKSEKFTMKIFFREGNFIYIPDQVNEITKDMIYIPLGDQNICLVEDVQKSEGDKTQIILTELKPLLADAKIQKRELILENSDYISGFYKII